MHSPLFDAWREALREAGRLGAVLDVACGRGRHALAAAELGARSVGLDRNAEALRLLGETAQQRALPVSRVRADLERDGLPLREASCGAVLVFRYLWRPLAPALAALLRPGGLLLYETFTRDQRDLPYGPGNPDFLLEPGELRNLFPGLQVESYQEAVRTDASGRPWHLASLAARAS